ncbi:hypothetical protein CWE15_05585 [Aliidiomarina taiwanensis]|uniref:BON domain-containing protein n=1 Tax=Aliidiomarina taiwanensis TaxID=946228 RepID=A0A432X7Q3_9GAMM|nr:BON domain-containing protein [Aliidiomarina taiwanensis]RUO42875.1 hypothetical protein CWE15_05585 [Aliidiomarina taiwanensis]
MLLRRLCILLLALIPLTGCTVLAVGGMVATTSVILDSRQVNTQIDDSGLHLHVVQGIQSDERLKNQRIRVVAYNGDVLLVGQVASLELKQRAERVAVESATILTVFNELKVGDPKGFIDRSKDSWITTRIKANLLSSNEIDTSGVKVVTEASEVFLLGIVDEPAAQHAVRVARNTPGVTRVVRAFSL